jgi:hypothetical protein
VPYARSSNPFFSPPALQYAAYGSGRPWQRVANPRAVDAARVARLRDLSIPIQPRLDPSLPGWEGYEYRRHPKRRNLPARSFHRNYEITFFKLANEVGIGWEVRDAFSSDALNRVVELPSGDELWAAPMPGVTVAVAEREAKEAIDQLHSRGKLRNPASSSFQQFAAHNVVDLIEAARKMVERDGIAARSGLAHAFKALMQLRQSDASNDPTIMLAAGLVKMAGEASSFDRHRASELLSMAATKVAAYALAWPPIGLAAQQNPPGQLRELERRVLENPTPEGKLALAHEGARRGVLVVFSGGALPGNVVVITGVTGRQPGSMHGAGLSAELGGFAWGYWGWTPLRQARGYVEKMDFVGLGEEAAKAAADAARSQKNPFFSPPALQYAAYGGGRPWQQVANPTREIHRYAVRPQRGQKVVAVLQAHNLDEARQAAAAKGFSGRRFQVNRVGAQEYARLARNPKALKTYRVTTAAGDQLGMVAAASQRKANAEAKKKFRRADVRVELVENYTDPGQAFMFGEDPMAETERDLKRDASGGQTFMFNPCPSMGWQQ